MLCSHSWVKLVKNMHIDIQKDAAALQLIESISIQNNYYKRAK